MSILANPGLVWVKLHGPYKSLMPKGKRRKVAVYATTIRELMLGLCQYEGVKDALSDQQWEMWVGNSLKTARNLSLEEVLDPRTQLPSGCTVHITPHVGVGAALPVWAIVAIVTVAVTIVTTIAMSLLFPPPENKPGEKERKSALYEGGLNVQKEGVPLSYIAGLDVLCGSNIIEGSIDYVVTGTNTSGGSIKGLLSGGAGGTGTLPSGPPPVVVYDPPSPTEPVDYGTADYEPTPYYTGGYRSRSLYYNDVNLEKGGGGGTPQTLKNTIFTDAYLRVLGALGDGPIGGIKGSTTEEKEKNIYINEIPLRDPGNNNRLYNGVTWEERLGTLGQAVVGVTPATANNIDANVQLKKALTQGGSQFYHEVLVTSKEVKAVKARIRFNSLMMTNDDGDQLMSSVSFGCDYKRVSDTAWTHAGTAGYRGKSSDPFVREAYIVAPPLKGDDTWMFRLYRTTPDATKDSEQSDTYFNGHVEYIDLDYKYDGTEGTASGVATALLGMGIDLQQFNDSRPPEVAVRVVGRKVRVPTNYNPVTRVYTGTWDGSWKYEATQNPVWHWYHLATNSPVGLGMSDTFFNKFSLYDTAKYCDENVNGRPRFTLNKQFTDETDGWKMLVDLATSFRAFCYFNGNEVVLVQDRDQTTPDHYVNNTMVADGVFNYNNKAIGERYNEVLIEWEDPSDYFRKKIERYRDTASINRNKAAGLSNNGIVSQTYTKIGCTSRQEAYDFARLLTYVSQNETETVSFTTMLNAAAYAPGQVIAVHDYTVSPTIVAGRVAGVAGNVMTLDQTFTQEAGAAYKAYLVIGNQLVIRDIATVGTTASVTTVTLSSGTGVAAEQPFGIVKVTGVQPRLYRIYDIQDAGAGKYVVNAIFYDRNKFAWVDTNVPAPVITYSDYNAVKTVPTPTGLKVTNVATEDRMLGTVQSLTLTWDQPVQTDNQGLMLRGYLVQVRLPNGTTTIIGDGGKDTFASLTAAEPGPYVFSVAGVNTWGKQGDEAVITYRLEYGSATDPVYPPTLIGLR